MNFTKCLKTITCCSEHFLKTTLSKRRNVVKRTFFVPHHDISEPQCHSPKLLNTKFCSLQSFRQKSKKSDKEKSESDSDSYDKDEDFIDGVKDKNTKVLQINVTSLRVDGVLKSALGMARNKVETLFYESKIRVNGKKIQKKSATLQEGDEIDLLKGPDPKNPNFMNVARVEILSIKPNEDSISVKVRRCKSLTIESY